MKNTPSRRTQKKKIKKNLELCFHSHLEGFLHLRLIIINDLHVDGCVVGARREGHLPTTLAILTSVIPTTLSRARPQHVVDSCHGVHGAHQGLTIFGNTPGHIQDQEPRDWVLVKSELPLEGVRLNPFNPQPRVYTVKPR